MKAWGCLQTGWTRALHRATACAWLSFAVLQLVAPRSASAQQSVEDILPLAQDPDDPIGLDRADAELLRSGRDDPPPAPSESAQAEERARFGPEPPPLSVMQGDVLSAVRSVRESAMRVRVELEPGLSLVTVDLVLENAAQRAAEARYRLPWPRDATLLSLQACNAAGCRPGIPDPSGPTELSAYDAAVQARAMTAKEAALPVAHARPTHDDRGHALIVRAAPVAKGRSLRVRVSFVARAPMHGGVQRLHLPARGMDPRTAPAEVTLHAPGLEGARIAGVLAGALPTRLDPFMPIDVSAHLPQTAALRASLARFPCGAAHCLRAHVSAAPAPAVAVDLVLALDVSPSMEGPARSRIQAALAAILSQAPKGSRVRALLFAGDARALLPSAVDPGTLSLHAFRAASEDTELGSATRFESAFALIERWGFDRPDLRRLVVILGDGGLTTGNARPFESARRRGIEVSAVNLADRATTAALVHGVQRTRGIVLEAGAQAELATRGSGIEALGERLAALFAPEALSRVSLQDGRKRVLLPALRAGEELEHEALVAGRGKLALQLGTRSQAPSRLSEPRLAMLAARMIAREAPPATLRALQAIDPRGLLQTDAPRTAPAAKPAGRPGPCDRRGPARRHGGINEDALPLALAEDRARCALPAAQATPVASPPPEPGLGLPSSPLHSMLRQRILPIARGCFRRDRAGRADYQVRAVFAFELADREVTAAAVTGRLNEALRSCLLQAVDTLAVPRFAGRVRVRYPLVTEKELLPAQIELTSDTAARLDVVLAQDAPSLP